MAARTPEQNRLSRRKNSVYTMVKNALIADGVITPSDLSGLDSVVEDVIHGNRFIRFEKRKDAETSIDGEKLRSNLFETLNTAVKNGDAKGIYAVFLALVQYQVELENAAGVELKVNTVQSFEIGTKEA